MPLFPPAFNWLLISVKHHMGGRLIFVKDGRNAVMLSVSPDIYPASRPPHAPYQLLFRLPLHIQLGESA